jgi:hypothetical protein
MAINRDKGFKDFSTNAGGNPAPVEGGGDAALALTSAVQAQALEMAAMAQATNLSIEMASTQLANYMVDVMSGRALLAATLDKVNARVEAERITYSTEVKPIDLGLPSVPEFGATRQKFLGLFEPAPAIANPFYEIAPAADEVGTDENL